MGENQLKIFKRLVEMLFNFSNMNASYNSEATSISVLLYDDWLHCENPGFTIDEGVSSFTTEKRIKVLLDSLNVLDPEDNIRHVLLDYGEECDEFDYRISTALKGGHLDTMDSFRLRMMVLNATALGSSFVSMGKLKNGLHFFLVATKLHQRLRRVSKKLWFDDHLAYNLCELILNTTFACADYDTGVEYGSRMAHRIDVAVDEAHADVVKFKETWERDFGYLNIGTHFENSLTLAGIAKNVEEYCIIALALRQAIEMFMVERLVGEPGQIEAKIAAGLNSNFLSIPRDWTKEKIIMELSLGLVVANELGKGDPKISFKFAQKSLEQFHLMCTDKDAVDAEKESSLHFLVGRMTYGYVLSLAGGKRIASSPPISALPPSAKSSIHPSIKDLLEESMTYLEKAFENAPDDDLNPSGKDGIAMQV